MLSRTKVMKILPANSEGCWIFFCRLVLSFFCHSCFAVSFFVVFLLFCCNFCVICLSFSHPARVAGSGAELESPKTQFHQHAGHVFFVIVLSFSQASGEGGKPGLGNAKKNAKKWFPVWEKQKNAKNMIPSLGNAKKCKENANKCKKIACW